MFADFKNKQLIGFDLKEKMIQFAIKHHKANDTSFVVGDITDDFDKLSSDVGIKSNDADIVSVMCLMHWIDGHTAKVIQNISKMLKSGID